MQRLCDVTVNEVVISGVLRACVSGRPLEDRARKAAAAGVAGQPGGAGAGNSLWHLSRKLVRLLVTHEVLPPHVFLL